MILDGKQLSQELKDEMRQEVDALAQKYGRRPCLMVVIVGNNPASQSYVRGKIKATEYVGFDGSLVSLPEDVTEDALIAEIERLNQNELVDGILVQLPLPKHISEDRVIAAISPEKDVDGFHATNVARLWLNQPCIVPCTPKGVIVMLDRAGIEITGKNAVVVGRSNIVGKPVAKLLLDRNATVTIAHSRTKNLKEVCRQADILVVAIGKPKFVDETYVKEGAVVIDVGIHRDAQNKLCGDVDFEKVAPHTSAITPVPGGVGPMTIAMLMNNCVSSVE